MNFSALYEKYITKKLAPHQVEPHWIKTDSGADLYSFRYVHPQSDEGRIDESMSSPPLGRLVLVHGLGSNASGYARLIVKSLPYVSELIAISAPGHGLSPRNPNKDRESLYHTWEEALLSLSQTEPVTLLGTSLGGAVSLRFALAHPHRVKALILCSPAGAQLDEEAIDYIRAHFDMTDLSAGSRFLKALYHRPPRLSALFGLFLRFNFKRAEVRSILDDLQPGVGLTAEELSTLSPPTILFWGESERILPPSMLEFYKQHLPPSTLFKHPPTFGHCPHIENPTLLLQEMINWIDHSTRETT